MRIKPFFLVRIPVVFRNSKRHYLAYFQKLRRFKIEGAFSKWHQNVLNLVKITFFGHILDIKMRIKCFSLVRIPVLFSESVKSNISSLFSKIPEIPNRGSFSKWPPKCPKKKAKITFFGHILDTKMRIKSFFSS